MIGGHFANDMGKSLLLGHVALVALMHAMSIDTLPSPRVDKGKMTWADAHDESVSVVESLGIERLGTACMLDCPWYSRCTLEQRSREAAQRVDEEVVYDASRKPYNYLQQSGHIRTGNSCGKERSYQFLLRSMQSQ